LARQKKKEEAGISSERRAERPKRSPLKLSGRPEKLS